MSCMKHLDEIADDLNVSTAFLMHGEAKMTLEDLSLPEVTLFTTAIFGGSLGTTLGMFLFHHKTRHWYFLYGMPLILFLQLLLFYIIAHSPVTITIL